MNPHVEPDLPARKAGEEPDLPESACRVERMTAQLLHRLQHFALSPWRRNRVYPEVFGDVEVGIVDPERAAPESPGLEDGLPETRDEMQP